MEGLLFVISIEFLIGEACPCWSVNMNNCACGLTLVFETSTLDSKELFILLSVVNE